MWIPQSTEQIEDAARGDRFEQLPSLEAKRELPAAKKNADIAVDVAAMSTAGGVIVYGVGEDESGRPTIPRPIKLAGAAERVAHIVQSSIDEAPLIETRELAVDADGTTGYLVVIVPKSPRVPHMVSAGSDFRYYGRGAKGNRILTEGEVARLYREREEWEVDRDRLLDRVISVSPHQPIAGAGYLHAFARPAVLLDEVSWRRVVGEGGPGALLRDLSDAVSAPPVVSGYDGALRQLADWRRQGAEVWRFGIDNDNPEHAVRCDIAMDGRASLFWGGAARTRDGQFILFDLLVAATVASFLSVANRVYERAVYHGPVDIGIALTGLRGARAALPLYRGGPPPEPYRAHRFAYTRRVLAAELRSAEVVARQMLRLLFDATIGEGLDPFDQALA